MVWQHKRESSKLRTSLIASECRRKIEDCFFVCLFVFKIQEYIHSEFIQNEVTWVNKFFSFASF